MTVEPGQLSITMGHEIEPMELRRSLLFWDRLVWPKNSFVDFGDGPEIQFLSDEGILERPKINLPSGDAALGMAKAHVQAFVKLDQAEPGVWAMSEGPDSFVWSENQRAQTRGTLVTLSRAIPVPEDDIPLEELLNFKTKRINEVHKLTSEIDCLYTNISNAKDSEFELVRCLREIDQRASDMIKVCRESKFRFRLSDFRLSFSAGYSSVMASKPSATAGEMLGAGIGLPGIGALVGGALPFLSIGKNVVLARSAVPESPYRFVGQLHSDII